MPTYSNIIVTSNTIVDAGYDMYLIDATNGNVIMTMFEILSDGHVMIFKRIDGGVNTVSIIPNGVETIDGNSTLDLPASSSISLVSNGGNWYTFN